MKKKKHIVTIIRRSCLTGNVVWIYRGPSHTAAQEAYRRACKKELERVRKWSKVAARRCANVARILTACTERMPLTADMTAEQRESARRLQAISKQEQPCHREFYDHIVEEARRRNEASARWREQRKKWFSRKK